MDKLKDLELQIISITDKDDNTCEVVVDMNPETLRFLVNYAVLDILRKGLSEVAELNSGDYHG